MLTLLCLAMLSNAIWIAIWNRSTILTSTKLTLCPQIKCGRNSLQPVSKLSRSRGGRINWLFNDAASSAQEIRNVEWDDIRTWNRSWSILSNIAEFAWRDWGKQNTSRPRLEPTICLIQVYINTAYTRLFGVMEVELRLSCLDFLPQYFITTRL
jgi:hypothetical protein